MCESAKKSIPLGPDGGPMTLSDLPSSRTQRWVIRRKAAVICAVRGGLISLDDACRAYGLSIEEFLSWKIRVESAYGGRSGAASSRRPARPHGG